jgi:cytochrome c oxidase assembly protein subunit 15
MILGQLHHLFEEGNAMAQNYRNAEVPILDWHRRLLAAAAIFTVLLIGMGGVLCVTQSIRSCPDWPGCFGKIIPPLEMSPILEVTHRVLAGISALLILGAAIAGLARARRLPWIVFPPLAAGVLLVEVSYFGAMVVLHGVSLWEAGLDVGSALLATALMVAAAVIARAHQSHPTLAARLAFRTSLSRLGLATVVVVYGVFISGILVAGKNSITACLGWPIYSTQLFQVDSLGMGNILRLTFSVLGIGLIVATLVQVWRSRQERPAMFGIARWVLAAFLLEALLQVLLLIFGFKIPLLVPYTVTAALLWGLLVALGISIGLEAA